jgi:CHAT domain-containing protein
MTGTRDDIGNLLDELRAAPRTERLALLREHGEPGERLAALGGAAEHLALHDVSRALEAGQMLVELADQVGDPVSRSVARRALGRAFSYAGRFQDGLLAYRDAVRIAELAGAPVEAARARLSSLHPLGELSRYEEALAEGEAARKQLLAAGQPRLAARADANLGVIHQNRDDPVRALAHLDRARQALGDEPVPLGFIENNRGEALLALHEFDAARDAFIAGREASEKVGANLAAAIAEGNLADLAARRGLLSQALFHFERARTRFEADQAGSHMARLLAEQAEALEALGAAEDALVYYRDALPRLQQHGMAFEIARARTGLGKALMRFRRFAEADDELRRAEEGFAALRHGVARGRALLVRAELALVVGDLEGAAARLDMARQALRDRPIDAARWHLLSARLALAQGRLERSEQELAAAHELLAALDLAPLMAELLHARGRLRGAQARRAEAAADWREALRHVERIRGTLQAHRLRHTFLADRLALYADLVLAELERDEPSAAEAAFDVAELAKSRVLLELAQGDGEQAEDPDDRAGASLGARLRTLQQELNALYSQLSVTDHRGRSLHDQDGWREAVRRREQELSTLEARRAAAARDGVALDSRPVRLEALRQQLGAHQGLIEYFIAGDELVCFVVTRRGIRSFRRLASGGTIEEAARRLRFQLHRAMRPDVGGASRAARLIADARRELHRQHQLLIAPLGDALDGLERLTIVPHGPLHLTPFHALWDGTAHLLERFEINAAPSASLFATLSAAAPADAARRPPLVVGVADEYAPDIADEAGAVAAALDGALLLGEQATCRAVQQAAPRAGLLHLACHGRYASLSPLSSGVRLADGWLTVRDIAGLRLEAELVTLSGCQTGRSLVEAGDELMGLLRGFLAAGARSLLVSLWPTHDARSSRMMTRFYELWRSAAAVRKTAALRRTQLEAAAEGVHPVYWAPFVLVGKP